MELDESFGALLEIDAVCDIRGLESGDPETAVFGDSLPMAAIFLVDRTWQPILNTCINAVSMVFEDYMKSRDRFGMY